MPLVKERISILAGGFEKGVKKLLKQSKVSLFVLLPLVALSSAPAKAQPNSFDSKSIALNKLEFTLDSLEFVTAKKDFSEINPGESLAQKKIREQKENEEKERQRKESLVLAQRNTISREGRALDRQPVSFEQIYQTAGQRYGVDPMLLKAVHFVETGFSGSSYIASYAGAQGPMQFMPATWKRYGVDGNGDGIADIGNVYDSIHSAANYLKACGYPDLKKALWGYNRSTPYYHKVVNLARSYGMGL